MKLLYVSISTQHTAECQSTHSPEDLAQVDGAKGMYNVLQELEEIPTSAWRRSPSFRQDTQ